MLLINQEKHTKNSQFLSAKKNLAFAKDNVVRIFIFNNFLFLSFNIYSGSCRSFKMKIDHEAKGANLTDGEPAFRYERDFSCTICCLNRYLFA